MRFAVVALMALFSTPALAFPVVVAPAPHPVVAAPAPRPVVVTPSRPVMVPPPVVVPPSSCGSECKR